MKKHIVWSLALNILVVALAITAWSTTVQTITSLSIASLIGVLAFSLMWVHYVADFFAPRGDNEGRDLQYWLSRIAVLVAILSHPFLINWYLLQNGFGLPPASYEKLLGTAMWAVLFGWVALVAFLAFELRGKLQRYERVIFHANVLAMFLVLIHGFVAGLVMMRGWYFWVWLALMSVFALVIVKRYGTYYKADPNRRLIAWAIVGLLTLAAGVAGFVTKSPSSSSPSVSQTKNVTPSSPTGTTGSSPNITQAELESNTGRDGAKCWLVVDGTVYDATGDRQWVNGSHVPSNGLAACGRDLSDVIGQSPHGRSVLRDLQVIGKISN